MDNVPTLADLPMLFSQADKKIAEYNTARAQAETADENKRRAETLVREQYDEILGVLLRYHEDNWYNEPYNDTRLFRMIERFNK